MWDVNRITSVKHLENLAGRLGTRNLVAAGAMAAALLIMVVGLSIVSDGSAQNMSAARAALVGSPDRQGLDVGASVAGQDGAQLPADATSTPAAAEPTTAPVTATAEATAPAAPPASRGGPRVPPVTVAIDPGHGGWDSGAVYKDPAGGVFTEKEATLQVGLRVQRLLAADGFNVVMTRTSDTSVGGSAKGQVGADLQGRIDIANAANADVLVSIHFNAASNPATRGTETLYNANRPHAAQNLRLAQQVNSALISTMQTAGYASLNRGVKTDVSTGRGQFYLLAGSSVTRPSRMPAVIGEGLFISNPTEATLLKKPEFLDTLAKAYASAIADYFGL